MSRGSGSFINKLDVYSKIFVANYGQQVIDLLELPIKVVLSPFTLAFDIAGSAPRGFGIPELASHLSFTAIFAVATLGTYDIALELGKKVLCQSDQGRSLEWLSAKSFDNILLIEAKDVVDGATLVEARRAEAPKDAMLKGRASKYLAPKKGTPKDLTKVNADAIMKKPLIRSFGHKLLDCKQREF